MKILFEKKKILKKLMKKTKKMKKAIKKDSILRIKIFEKEKYKNNKTS